MYININICKYVCESKIQKILNIFLKSARPQYFMLDKVKCIHVYSLVERMSRRHSR